MMKHKLNFEPQIGGRGCSCYSKISLIVSPLLIFLWGCVGVNKTSLSRYYLDSYDLKLKHSVLFRCILTVQFVSCCCFRRWASSLWFLASSTFTSGWLTAKKRRDCLWRIPENLSVSLPSWPESPSYSPFEPSETAASCPFPKPTSTSQSHGHTPSLQKYVLKSYTAVRRQKAVTKVRTGFECSAFT